jgi:hypothetical protein
MSNYCQPLICELWIIFQNKFNDNDLNDIIDLFKIFTIYSKAQVFVYMFNLSYRSCAILLLFLTFVFKSKVVVNIMSHRQLQIKTQWIWDGFSYLWFLNFYNITHLSPILYLYWRFIQPMPTFKTQWVWKS